MVAGVWLGCRLACRPWPRGRVSPVCLLPDFLPPTSPPSLLPRLPFSPQVPRASRERGGAQPVGPAGRGPHLRCGPGRLLSSLCAGQQPNLADRPLGGAWAGLVSLGLPGMKRNACFAGCCSPPARHRSPSPADSPSSAPPQACSTAAPRGRRRQRCPGVPSGAAPQEPGGGAGPGGRVAGCVRGGRRGIRVLCCVGGCEWERTGLGGSGKGWVAGWSIGVPAGSAHQLPAWLFTSAVGWSAEQRGQPALLTLLSAAALRACAGSQRGVHHQQPARRLRVPHQGAGGHPGRAGAL